MIHRYILLVFVSLYFSTFNVFSHHVLPEGFVSEEVITNLNPTCLAIADDGRIFLGEKQGDLRLIEDDVMLDEPLLTVEVNYKADNGLLGIALDPDFGLNGYIYLYYSSIYKDILILDRYTINGQAVVPGSKKELFRIDEEGWGDYHSGGGLCFGLDGKLYISTGDQAKPKYGQSFSSLNGKVLRINKNGTIPSDNPFFNKLDGDFRAIYALGFRNPFSLDIDPLTGRIFLCDVGLSTYEEVNEVLGGKNYGWPEIEGPYTGGSKPSNYEEPIHYYHHDEGCAAVGAAFYSPNLYTFPEEYHGKFFFTEFCKNVVYYLDPDTKERKEFMGDLNFPVSVTTDQNTGAMYILERGQLGSSNTSGRLIRVQYTGGGSPFVSTHPKDYITGNGEKAQFKVEALGLDTLHYKWYINGVVQTNSDSSLYTIEATNLAMDGDEISVMIYNQLDTAYSDTAILTIVNGTSPSCNIDVITPAELYHAGDIVNYIGTATDVEDGDLPAASYSWQIDLHHNVHSHQAVPGITGVKEGVFEIPQYGELDIEVWYRFSLSVTDVDGLSCNTYVDVLPELDTMFLFVDPSDLEFNLDGKAVSSGDTVVGVVGMARSVEAIKSQNSFGKRMAFEKWQDGNKDYIREFFFGEFDELTAKFKEGGYYIYPNPSYGYLNIAIDEADKPFDYQILDSQGKPITEGHYSGGEEIELQISTLDLVEGLYFFRIIDNSQDWSSKFFHIQVE